MNPIELKSMNLFEQGETSILGWTINSYGLPECIDRAVKASNWNKKREAKIPKRGIGIACALHQTAWRGAYGSIETSCAVIIAKEDGSFNLYTDLSELGTGVWTVAQAVAAETIGCRLEDIEIVGGDTSNTPFDLGSYASRGTYSLGNAVKFAAVDIRNQLFNIAATMLEVAVGDLEAKEGRMYVRKTLDKNILIAEVCNYAHFTLGKPIMSKGIWNSPASLFDPETGKWPSPGPTTSLAYACHIAEIEVDPGTGKVKVLSVLCAQDVGYPINLTAIEGQIEGGITMALGFSLTDNMCIAEGEVLTTNFTDFSIRGTLDIPEIETIIVATNDPYGPFGAKGVGELVGNPVAAAIANAIYNAVGIRIKELPIDPEKIIGALKG